MPLAKNYKNPLEKSDVSNEANSIGPIGQDTQMPPAREPIEAPEPPPTPAPKLDLSTIPMITDNTGKQQVDYSALAKNMYSKNAQQYDDNDVSRADLDEQRDVSTSRALMSGLAKASAMAGGSQTVFPDVVKGLEDADKTNLESRYKLAGNAYTNANSSLDRMQSAPLKMLESDQALKATDPSSQLSKFARDYYKTIIPGGKSLPDNMSAADIAKFSPDIVRMASDKANKEFQMKLAQMESSNRNKLLGQTFANEKELKGLDLESRLALEGLRASQMGAPGSPGKPMNAQAAELSSTLDQMKELSEKSNTEDKEGKNPYSNPLNYLSEYLPIKTNEVKGSNNSEYLWTFNYLKASGYPRITPELVEQTSHKFFRRPSDNDSLALEKLKLRENAMKGIEKRINLTSSLPNAAPSFNANGEVQGLNIPTASFE